MEIDESFEEDIKKGYRQADAVKTVKTRGIEEVFEDKVRTLF